MRQSEQISTLAAALAAFQGDVEGAKKASTNPHFKSKYADLAAVWDAIRSPLAKHKLSAIQLPTVTPEGRTILVTRIMHASGEWLEGEWPIDPVRNDPQGLGSATTYGRRYSLMAALGIAPEDDDGETASGRGDGPPAVRQSAQRSAPPQTKEKGPEVENDPEKAEARAHWLRISKALKAAKNKADIDGIFEREGHALATIKKANAEAYGGLIKLANDMDDQFAFSPADAA